MESNTSWAFSKTWPQKNESKGSRDWPKALEKGQQTPDRGIPI